MVGPVDLGGPLLPGIVDFFEEGAAVGKRVLEFIGNDVAAFCDDLSRISRTYVDVIRNPSRKSPLQEKSTEE